MYHYHVLEGQCLVYHQLIETLPLLKLLGSRQRDFRVDFSSLLISHNMHHSYHGSL